VSPKPIASHCSGRRSTPKRSRSARSSDGAFELLRRYLRQNAAVKNGVDLAVPRARKLSDRERQVLGHLIRGRTNKTIAQRLGVSESTVKTQVGRI
jgi:DNA-binding NarL/FixJ family response regulator